MERPNGPQTIEPNIDGKSISIPLTFIGNKIEGNELDKIKIHLQHENIPILGEYRIQKNELIFSPLISFTPGLIYHVDYNTKKIAQFELKGEQSTFPTVLSVFPIQDTIPENLLKVYILFSHPMQSGNVLQQLRLVQNETDTLTDVFMDLQNELWNTDQTMLTVWFNPGRIKRGLQPNEKSGTPIIKGNSYELIISNEWQSTNRNTLLTKFNKVFYVGNRDSMIVSTDHWNITTTTQNNRTSLDIRIGEVLDHELLKSTISLLDASGNSIPAQCMPNAESNLVQLVFDKILPKGKYTIRVESHLEDLAGNNLNRLFDMEYGHETSRDKAFYDKPFMIK